MSMLRNKECDVIIANASFIIVKSIIKKKRKKKRVIRKLWRKNLFSYREKYSGKLIY